MLSGEETFTTQLRDVLAHLYDYPYLQTHPLAMELAPGEHLSARERMRLLRAKILEAVEEMNPGPSVPLRSRHARSYSVLNLHYVEGLMIQEVARELALSERQVYRDLRKAEEELWALIWNHCEKAVDDSHDVAPPHPHTPSRAELVLQEADRLPDCVESVSVRVLLDGAMSAVQQLAQQRTIHLECTVVPRRDTVLTNHQIARQALVSTLSHAVRNAQPGTGIDLRAESDGSGLCIRIACILEERSEGQDMFPPVARHLVRRLGGQSWSQADECGRAHLTFTLRDQGQTTMLVIDDNQGLVELFQRYLTGEEVQLIDARDGPEGLRLAEERAPDVILLDVMMPQQDGWEILQRLKAQESTRYIPVIVCSVLDDPELAYSLGAAGFLAKPVSRTQLLRALSRCQGDI
jgi:CheY-like chemotaxis protein